MVLSNMELAALVAVIGGCFVITYAFVAMTRQRNDAVDHGHVVTHLLRKCMNGGEDDDDGEYGPMAKAAMTPAPDQAYRLEWTFRGVSDGPSVGTGPVRRRVLVGEWAWAEALERKCYFPTTRPESAALPVRATALRMTERYVPGQPSTTVAANKVYDVAMANSASNSAAAPWGRLRLSKLASGDYMVVAAGNCVHDAVTFGSRFRQIVGGGTNVQGAAFQWEAYPVRAGTDVVDLAAKPLYIYPSNHVPGACAGTNEGLALDGGQQVGTKATGCRVALIATATALGAASGAIGWRALPVV